MRSTRTSQCAGEHNSNVRQNIIIMFERTQQQWVQGKKLQVDQYDANTIKMRTDQQGTASCSTQSYSLPFINITCWTETQCWAEVIGLTFLTPAPVPIKMTPAPAPEFIGNFHYGSCLHSENFKAASILPHEAKTFF